MAVTCLAGLVVLSKINLHETGKWLHSVPLWLVGIAFLLYNSSQVVSTVRLALFFRAERIPIAFHENLRLYYQGMFYNLFLPGGIGGDGYKVYRLNQWHNVPVKISVRALIADRANGALALLILSVLMTPFAAHAFFPGWIILTFISVVIVMASAWAVVYFFIPTLRSCWLQAFFYSVAVQIIQLLAATILFFAFDVPLNELTDYGTVFFISSLASAIPFTLGGLGARELVFVLAADYTAVHPDKAVAFALLFFLISAISSLPGGIIPSPAK